MTEYSTVQFICYGIFIACMVSVIVFYLLAIHYNRKTRQLIREAEKRRREREERERQMNREQ